MRNKSFLLIILMAAGFICTIDNINGIGVEEAVAQTPPPCPQPLVVNQAPPAAPTQDVIPRPSLHHNMSGSRATGHGKRAIAGYGFPEDGMRHLILMAPGYLATGPIAMAIITGFPVIGLTIKFFHRLGSQPVPALSRSPELSEGSVDGLPSIII